MKKMSAKEIRKEIEVTENAIAWVNFAPEHVFDGEPIEPDLRRYARRLRDLRRKLKDIKQKK